jgi:abhydrolase domain-containing protein 12
MPWDQTEKLFRSTVEAASGASRHEGAPVHRVIDLGEAGRQEIWKAGAVHIDKLIAKHGGKKSPPLHREPRR